MKSRLMLLAMVVLMVSPLVAQDEPAKKGKRAKNAAAQSASAQLLKQMEAVKLTDEQVEKIKAMGKVTQEAIAKINKEAGLTPELLKKRREVTASMKDSDKKGKARGAAINAAVGLDEAQVAAIGKANELRMKLKADAIKLLSDEQKEKLPAALKPTTDKKAGAKKDGAKKKDA
jgi:hypothetical protein